MRNDARPIGEDSPASPIGGHETPPDGSEDPRDGVSRDPQSPVGADAAKPELDHESPRPAPGTYHPE